MKYEAGWAKNMIQNQMAHIAASLIPMFILLWTIQAGIRLATDPGNGAKYNQFALLIGIITITFGTIYFIIGLGIVAELVLGWSSRLLGKEDKKTAVPRDLTPTNGKAAAREMKTTQRDTGRLAATMITMIMLLWAIFTGFRLVTESTRRDRRYGDLAISLGVVAIFFGLVYFIIGLAILADLILHVSDEMQNNEKDYNIHIDGFIEV